MNLAIIGSRNYEDYERLCSILSNVKTPIHNIVSGGARGADKLGARYALEHDIPLIEYLPDWEQFGNRAGFIRNADIINDSDGVIAFWDGVSKGTASSIKLAEKKGIPVKIIHF